MPLYSEPVYAPNFFVTGELSGDYDLPGTAIARGASAPDLAQFRGSLYQYAFAGTGPTVEEAFYGFIIRHDIKPTSHIHLILRCAHNIDSGTYTPDTADVKWNIDFSLAKTNAAFPAETTVSTVLTMGAQYVHQATSHADMPITDSFEPNSIVLCRVYRDPGDVEDTFEYDCFLLDFHVHILVGQLGLNEEDPPYPQFT